MKSLMHSVVVLVVVACLAAAQAAGAQVFRCPSGAEYEQPFDPGNTLHPYDVSDQEHLGAQAWGNIVDAGGAITTLSGAEIGRVVVWGNSTTLGSGASDCPEDNSTPFGVTFYSDNMGSPGLVVASAVGAVTFWSDIGVDVGGLSVYEFTLDFPTIANPGTMSWISVRRQVGLAGCAFAWANETLLSTYDNLSWTDAGFGGFSSRVDRTFCIGPRPQGTVEIPTLAPWGAAALVLLLAAAGGRCLRARWKA